VVIVGGSSGETRSKLLVHCGTQQMHMATIQVQSEIRLMLQCLLTTSDGSSKGGNGVFRGPQCQCSSVVSAVSHGCSLGWTTDRKSLGTGLQDLSPPGHLPNAALGDGIAVPGTRARNSVNMRK